VSRRRLEPFRPLVDRRKQTAILIDMCRDGWTLREAAAAIDIHVATVCRWQARCPALAEALATARDVARRRKYATKPRPGPRPRVPVHPKCPACGNAVEVRKALYWPFWRCSRWPHCRWASWLPRHPEDCPRCDGPRSWSSSRKSVSCRRCGTRGPA